jgi:hypothetical protein
MRFWESSIGNAFFINLFVQPKWDPLRPGLRVWRAPRAEQRKTGCKPPRSGLVLCCASTAPRWGAWAMIDETWRRRRRPRADLVAETLPCGALRNLTFGRCARAQRYQDPQYKGAGLGRMGLQSCERRIAAKGESGPHSPAIDAADQASSKGGRFRRASGRRLRESRRQ